MDFEAWGTIAAVKRRVGQLQGEINSWARYARKLEGQIAGLRREIDDRERQRRKMQQTIAGLEEQLAQKEEAINRLGADLKEKEAATQLLLNDLMLARKGKEKTKDMERKLAARDETIIRARAVQTVERMQRRSFIEMVSQLRAYLIGQHDAGTSRHKGEQIWLDACKTYREKFMGQCGHRVDRAHEMLAISEDGVVSESGMLRFYAEVGEQPIP